MTTWMIKITQQGDYGKASALGLLVVAVLLVFATFFLTATRERGGGRRGAGRTGKRGVRA
ncbi:hypothetical protein ACFSUJ_15795 [Streptomyces lusitanus]|uniref:hypothetical protein n=1 Tax=Streptomyces lusitanus TaxID=68232 RepID=UPI003642B646